MESLRMLLSRVASLVRGKSLDAELDDELRSHIELAAEENVKRGMRPDEAREAAVRAFGGVTQTRERYRTQRGVPFFEVLGQDLRQAGRQLKNAPAFTLTVVAILALGIGANTTVFSIVDAVMLRPLPYAHPERLVEVESYSQSLPEGRNVSYPDFFDWRAQNKSFEHLVSYHEVSNTLTGVSRAVHLDGQATSWDLLPMLGVRPELGRGFVASEEKRGSRVILISHAFWQSQFGGDPGAVGRTVHLDGDAYTVIGVMPESFRFPVTEPLTDFWTTLAWDDDPTDVHPAVTNRGMHFLNAMGRLRPGVTVEQADHEIHSIAGALAKQYPKTNTRHSEARVVPELKAMLGDTQLLMLVVLGAVGLVLVIACGNIANLLLTRVRERQREIAMRSALGAGRRRIVRQLLTESVVLSVVGGALGCALAFGAVPAVLGMIGKSVPRAADAGVDLRVLGFALGVTVLSALVFGIVPAMTASKTDLVRVLQQGGPTKVAGRDWLRKVVTVAQVALGIVLTAGAGLLAASFVTLARADKGFNPDHLLTLNFETPDAAYKDTRPQFYRDYFERLRALPGVVAAGGSIVLPMSDDEVTISFENPEKPVDEGSQPSADLTPVTPEYFRTIQTPMVAGRDFSDADNMQAPQVMIINQAFAKQFFPGEDPIGKKLKPGAGNGSKDGPPWRQIVGVVGDVRMSATQREMRPAMYLPVEQMPNWCCVRTVVRTSVPPLSMETPVRQLVTAMDANIPVTEVRTMQDLVSLELSQPRFAMVLLGSFAGLALLLTVVGLYGVMAYSVARQTREIGLRLALGAQRTAVLRMVLRDASMLLAAGIAIGLAGALIAGPVLRAMLYGTGPRNPALLAGVVASVAMAGLLAAFIPAMRAASIDPSRALRTE
ncbi:MAG TPA: ABC transporter permease [Terracidiphilus sp.]|nr:ABC transporter permease [Terracidiphilus sp.]